jgi:hypothetical protein
MSKTHVIDGKKYVEVHREAGVGEYVIIKSNGVIVKVIDRGDFGIFYSKGNPGILDHGYLVLEPLEETPDITDLLANLARRVSSLEQQLSATQSNVEKLAEELENAKHRVSKHATMFGVVEERVGMLTDDIITLDERSQLLNAINQFYEEGSR